MRRKGLLALVAFGALFALAPTANAQVARRPRLATPVAEPLVAELCDFEQGPALCASTQSATLNLHDKSLTLRSTRPIGTDGRRSDVISETLTLDKPFATRDGLLLPQEETHLDVSIEIGSAGAIRQSFLIVRPDRTLITINKAQLILIGYTAKGEPVYLKPGLYDLKFSGVLNRIQTDARSFIGDPETGRVTGGKFRQNYPYERGTDDTYLQSATRFPAGSLVMDAGKSAIGVFGLLLRRPQIRIPTQSYFYFTVDSVVLSRMDAGPKAVYGSK